MQNRRDFLSALGVIAAGTILSSPLKAAFASNGKKLQVVLVGTGDRGNDFWGKRLVANYSDILEFTALVDINPGRVKYAAGYIGVENKCGLYTSFEEMLENHQPDLVIVATTDATHHEYIINALKNGIDVITEKPITTDEHKMQAILDAEQRYKRKVIVGFNLRWSPYALKVKELLSQNIIGDIVSVDFSWMLNTSHGASYFRRWHGQREHSGTLLVHKSTHHFDLLNWWLESEPEEVYARGDLEFYGRNPKKKGVNCRSCNEKDSCKFYWDITDKGRDAFHQKLYVDHEKYDGYIRDNCLFRPEINIYDKMNLSIKYANNVYANYMLTTYSPWEGWRIAFNGKKGRLEAFVRIPYMSSVKMSQEELHGIEMSQEGNGEEQVEPIIIHKLWDKEQEIINFHYNISGHGGGDARLQDKIFLHPERTDPLKQSAGIREGAMSALIGIAARNSIELGRAVRIGSLTDLQPRAKSL